MGERGGEFLYVAYFFPPIGGAGVQRTVKFCRYLPERGWRPHVVTVRHAHYWIDDPTLAAELGEETTVHRTASLDGVALMGALRGGAGRAARSGGQTSRLKRLSSWLLHPDAYRPWKPFALRAARRVVRDHPVRAILTTSSPDSSHLIGRDLARETGLPWIADFRDPWTERISYDPPTRLHDRLQQGAEADVLESADHVVVTTDETKSSFTRRHPGLDAAKVSVIPNGYDPSDFDGSTASPSCEQFTLAFVGQLTAGRTVAPLLPVLSAFFDTEPEARTVTRVRFVGPVETENRALVDAAGLGEVVRFEEPRPHREAIEVLRGAHVTLLVENMGVRAGLIAQGKLYEALFAGRPILALVPEGAVRRLLADHGRGASADPADPEPAIRLLIDAYHAWRGGDLLPGADRTRIAPFDRRALSDALADLLDRLTA